MPDALPARPPVELAVGAWVGHYAPQEDTAVDAGLTVGGRVRGRGSERWGLEAAGGWDRAGYVGSASVLAFLGDPSADLVVHGALGAGWQGGAGVYVSVGTGMDTRLFTALDLHVDGELRLDAHRDAALVFLVGPQVHTPRRYDRDADGVSDRDDACPAEPEDVDGHADADGCVDPDNDADGLVDADDACALVAEDRDGFLDRDGCPEPDNDGDGRDDVVDACMRFPEDPDGFQDGDGCPDPDNDADAVDDDADLCPNVPEDPDGFQDADGCPEPDNDGDGVGDRFDAAPLEAESRNGWRDADGAPDVIPPVLARFVGPALVVRWRGAAPSRSGSETLVLLATVLSSFPETRVEVRVSEPDATLAAARAEAIVAALVAGGVERARLEARVEQGPSGVRLALLP